VSVVSVESGIATTLILKVATCLSMQIFCKWAEEKFACALMVRFNEDRENQE
jgi:hypothetical protein